MCRKCSIPSDSKDPVGHNIVYNTEGGRVWLMAQRHYTKFEEFLYVFTSPILIFRVFWYVLRTGDPMLCDPTVIAPTGPINLEKMAPTPPFKEILPGSDARDSQTAGEESRKDEGAKETRADVGRKESTGEA